MLTSLILPWFYERYGLQNDYDVLFQESVRTPIFGVMIITTVISCVLSIIPMLFYDITESRQHEIIADLESRAQSENAEEKKIAIYNMKNKSTGSYDPVLFWWTLTDSNR